MYGVIMQDAFARETHEVAAFYSVDVNKGLSEQEVALARSKYGRNELEPEKSTPLWKLVLKQFNDLLVKILLAAAAVDFIIALSEGDSILGGMVEPSVILLILIANATVGVITERNAEKAIEELRAYEAESANVLRGGRVQVVASADLVPGDVVEVAVGGKVPADMRITHIYTSVLKVDQSLLTGESVATEKQEGAVNNTRAVYQDKTNMLFSGTLVVAGRARGVVTATGPSTAMGSIRDAMAEQEEVITPLKAKLNEFGELLSKCIAVVCVLVWIININRFTDPMLGGWMQGAIHYFKIAVALAVAAIPEGLPAVVTTCLALGTRRMAAHNAIVRTLTSVETLGCTTVICSDKTGTLTTNQMSVIKVAVVAGGQGGAALSEYDVTGTTFSPEGVVLGPAGAVVAQPCDAPCLLHAALCSALCNDSHVGYSREKGAMQRIGESTEIALRVFAEKIGLPASVRPPHQYGPPNPNEFAANAHWEASYPRVATAEFTRDRKMMSVLVRGEGRTLVMVKGAPEAVMARCTSVLPNSGEGPLPMTPAMNKSIMADMQVFGGKQALRCLALAFRPVPASTSTLTPADEQGLTFIGLVGMHDPPRPEVRAAIETCRAAGIRVIMVTGDNKGTAEAVARQVGILQGRGPSPSSSPGNRFNGGMEGVGDSRCFTGLEFDELGELGRAQACGDVCVLARVEPMHKLKLVEMLKAQGQVVAMTGDGVNDAPALVRADIGVGMGSGTAVARSAADMVLADDNFATIVQAVGEGRAIYSNTKQFIRYMISSNIGEVVAIFIATLMGMPEVLTPVQLLWVNLVTDGLPATALSFNKAEKDVMAQPPRSISEPIVNGWLFVRYVVIGVYVGLATITGFGWWFLGYSQGGNITWIHLTQYSRCDQLPGGMEACEVFKSAHPTTMAMTVLVVVEMFNALNNLSEDSSLLRVPPWSNRWLLGAIALSMATHFLILYIPFLAAIFGVAPLDGREWVAVLVLSAPVILVDEVMKVFSRRLHSRNRRGGAGHESDHGISMSAIKVDSRDAESQPLLAGYSNQGLAGGGVFKMQ